MNFRRELRTLIALALAASLACSPAQALVTLNDGTDRIYVTGTFGMTHDSNVYAANGSEGDYVYNSSLSAEYTRRAGWIGVNASAVVNSGKYGRITGEDFNDPSLSLEFTKQTGRTTGSVTLSGARETRADAAVNTRNSSWNYNAGLNFRYKISGTYDLSGQLGYSQREYIDELQYASLSSYSAGVDLFHVFTSERDLIVGYRYRFNETSRDTSSTDHAFTAGVNGKVMRGVSGSFRVGYQTRTPHGGILAGDSYQSWTANSTLSYAINKRINLAAQVSKDFSTTATDTSVDVLVVSLQAQYAHSSRLGLSGSVGWGDSQFLGESGRILLNPGPPALFGPNRHDNYLTWSAALSYSLNEHLKTSLSYMWFQNWSTLPFADFVKATWSLSVSSRW